MSLPRSPWIATSLPLLIEGKELPAEKIHDALSAMISGSVDEAEATAFLIALRMKGETAGEIRAAVCFLREKMVPLNHQQANVLDTCGTGGDGSGTFNISTAVSLVVAASGCPVVKHGNRSVSSRSGSADVLKELGVPIDRGPEWAEQCLGRFHYAFCFAPQFHPVLAHVGPLRRKLGVRTIFNLLGPLLNPAAAEHQLLGVGKLELLDPIAGALAQLKTRLSFVVCSEDGLDEVSLSAPTHVRLVRGEAIEAKMWTYRDFGLDRVSLQELHADGPTESAAMIQSILEGQDGASRQVVLANAAAALVAAQRANSLREGVRQAAATLDAGLALQLLNNLRQS